MTTPPRRPWPVADRDGPNPYASVTSDYGREVDRYAGKFRDFSRNLSNYLPVAGSALDAMDDFHEGDYARGAFNGAVATIEAATILPYAKALSLVKKVNDMRRKTTPFLARAGTQTNRIHSVGAVPTGHQVHHTIPMKGWRFIPKASRDAEGLLRNHPLNMKILPKHLHDGVHHGFGNRYTDPALQLWHGTNAFHKATAASVGTVAADIHENGTRSSKIPPAKQR